MRWARSPVDGRSHALREGEPIGLRVSWCGQRMSCSVDTTTGPVSTVARCPRCTAMLLAALAGPPRFGTGP